MMLSAPGRGDAGSRVNWRALLHTVRSPHTVYCGPPQSKMPYVVLASTPLEIWERMRWGLRLAVLTTISSRSG